MTAFYVAAHALIVNEEKKVLTLKRAECTDYMPLLWDIPGGTVEVGEKVEEALTREIMEEVNIEVNVLYPIHVYSNLSQLPRRQTIQIVYLCKYNGGNVVLNPDEHSAFKWVEYSCLKGMKCIAFLNDLLSKYHFNDYYNQLI